eukprot:TRINITY_DN57827_c0_g1_i1.p2 TRINITY_DN57827_c0_g1~~TRINITY_DN57827_c0_g1_i1.p2  ORF type:complete len:109 (-),score=32.14 TRINITY_DN57827_c0_g1_i1:49-351(-)
MLRSLVGSEMCIRDSSESVMERYGLVGEVLLWHGQLQDDAGVELGDAEVCNKTLRTLWLCCAATAPDTASLVGQLRSGNCVGRAALAVLYLLRCLSLIHI